MNSWIIIIPVLLAFAFGFIPVKLLGENVRTKRTVIDRTRERIEDRQKSYSDGPAGEFEQSGLLFFDQTRGDDQ